MESTNVFSQVLYVVLAAAVVVHRIPTVQAQVAGLDVGSGTGTLCTVGGPAEQCPEENTFCFQSGEDAEAECTYDPCTQGPTQTNGDCSPSSLCVSANDCRNTWPVAICNRIERYETHICVPSPCLEPVLCPPSVVCSFDILQSPTFQCSRSGGGVGNVCTGVNCNGRGTCTSTTNGASVVPICECDPGFDNIDTTTCGTIDLTPNPSGGPYRASCRLTIINYPWVIELLITTSAEYRALRSRFVNRILRSFGRFPGFRGVTNIRFRRGSVDVFYELLFDTPEHTDQILFTTMMGNLTSRVNAQTNVTEYWWGAFLQIDTSTIQFTTVAVVDATSTTSSTLLPAILGSAVAIIVVALAVVLLFYLGRVCRNRYYAGTYDDSEDTETTYQTSAQLRYWYTRNNPQSYGWGFHGAPNYWSSSPSQQQGNIRDQGDWRWTAQRRGVHSAS